MKISELVINSYRDICSSHVVDIPNIESSSSVLNVIGYGASVVTLCILIFIPTYIIIKRACVDNAYE